MSAAGRLSAVKAPQLDHSYPLEGGTSENEFTLPKRYFALSPCAYGIKS